MLDMQSPENQAAARQQAGQGAAVQKAIADESVRQVHARQAELEARCTKTRPVRASEVQLSAAYELKYKKDVEPKLAAIKARCRIPTTKAFGNGRHGLEVQTQEQQTVCKGGPPPGIKLEEAMWALQCDVSPSSEHLPIDQGDGLSDNKDCRELDQAVGLDTQVLNGDRPGLEKLLLWKAP